MLVDRYLAPLVENHDAIEAVIAYLSDEASRKQFRRELVFDRLFHLLLDYNDAINWAGNVRGKLWDDALAQVVEKRASGEYPELDFPSYFPDWVVRNMYAAVFVLEQYRHPQVEMPEGGVCLDCGACCGDAAVWALGRGAGHVYAFEPSPEMQIYLERNIERHGKGRITMIPYGIAEKSGRLDMAPTEDSNLMAGKMTEGGEGRITVVSLDDWTKENGITPDFIKMDLEGYETKALRGARRIITERRPLMAVSLYHDLKDFWEVPLILKEMVPEYRFWCRKNAPIGEFILYAAV
jgi:FkbM family methyltransferase